METQKSFTIPKPKTRKPSRKEIDRSVTGKKKKTIRIISPMQT